MADFTGKNICNTFQSILNLGSSATANCTLNGSSNCIVTDGIGQCSSLYLRTKGNGMLSCGTLQVAGGDIDACTGDIINVSNINAAQVDTTGAVLACGDITGGNDVIANNDLVSCNNTCVNNILTVTGVIRGCSDIISFYSSDERLKENVNKIVNSKEVVNNISGYSFDWKEEADREGKDFGVMAQDVEKVLPELVHERPDGFKSVDYVKLIPYLIEEVKRLDAEVEELKGA